LRGSVIEDDRGKSLIPLSPTPGGVSRTRGLQVKGNPRSISKTNYIIFPRTYRTEQDDLSGEDGTEKAKRRQKKKRKNDSSDDHAEENVKPGLSDKRRRTRTCFKGRQHGDLSNEEEKDVQNYSALERGTKNSDTLSGQGDSPRKNLLNYGGGRGKPGDQCGQPKEKFY